MKEKKYIQKKTIIIFILIIFSTVRIASKTASTQRTTIATKERRV